MHFCALSALEAEIGGSTVQGHLWLLHEFEVSLTYSPILPPRVGGGEELGMVAYGFNTRPQKEFKVILSYVRHSYRNTFLKGTFVSPTCRK